MTQADHSMTDDLREAVAAECKHVRSVFHFGIFRTFRPFHRCLDCQHVWHDDDPPREAKSEER